MKIKTSELSGAALDYAVCIVGGLVVGAGVAVLTLWLLSLLGVPI